MADYTLTEAERKAVEALCLAVSIGKVAVFDANLALEKHQAAAEGLRQRVQGTITGLRLAEERLAGATALLGTAHGVPGARLSEDLARVVEG